MSQVTEDAEPSSLIATVDDSDHANLEPLIHSVVIPNQPLDDSNASTHINNEPVNGAGSCIGEVKTDRSVADSDADNRTAQVDGLYAASANNEATCLKDFLERISDDPSTRDSLESSMSQMTGWDPTVMSDPNRAIEWANQQMALKSENLVRFLLLISCVPSDFSIKLRTVPVLRGL